jgi:hypothetical protein
MITNPNLKKLLVPVVAALFWVGPAEALAAQNAPDVSLNVKARTERDKTDSDETKEDVYGSNYTTTKETETETCTLKISVKMRDQAMLNCQLEWYFVSEYIKNANDRGTLKLFDPGKKAITLKDGVVLKEAISSKPFVLTTISRDRSDAEDKISGDEYKGYIVLVTYNGEILAKESSSDRFLKDEWLSQCKAAQ